MEFEEVREYLPGDEVRNIDWNVTARMGHPYVKRFREERDATVYLLVDLSASMLFTTERYSKLDRARELTALLAFAAAQNGDRVGLLLFGMHKERLIAPKKGRKHAMRIVSELFQPAQPTSPAGIGSLPSLLRRLLRSLPHRAICLLVSDLLYELPIAQLQQLQRRHDLVIAWLYDKAERQWPAGLRGIWELRELERPKEQLFDLNCSMHPPSEPLQALQERHQQLLQTMSFSYFELATDETPLAALRHYLLLRHHRQ